MAVHTLIEDFEDGTVGDSLLATVWPPTSPVQDASLIYDETSASYYTDQRSFTGAQSAKHALSNGNLLHGAQYVLGAPVLVRSFRFSGVFRFELDGPTVAGGFVSYCLLTDDVDPVSTVIKVATPTASDIALTASTHILGESEAGLNIDYPAGWIKFAFEWDGATYGWGFYTTSGVAILEHSLPLAFPALMAQFVVFCTGNDNSTYIDTLELTYDDLEDEEPPVIVAVRDGVRRRFS